MREQSKEDREGHIGYKGQAEQNGTLTAPSLSTILKTIRMRNSPLDFTVYGFHLGTEFVFSLRDTRITCHTRMKISLEMKTGMNSFWNDLYGNEISSRYHVNRYREIQYMEME